MLGSNGTVGDGRIHKRKKCAEIKRKSMNPKKAVEVLAKIVLMFGATMFI